MTGSAHRARDILGKPTTYVRISPKKRTQIPGKAPVAVCQKYVDYNFLVIAH
jgi:hypothetical protein